MDDIFSDDEINATFNNNIEPEFKEIDEDDQRSEMSEDIPKLFNKKQNKKAVKFEVDKEKIIEEALKGKIDINDCNKKIQEEITNVENYYKQKINEITQNITQEKEQEKSKNKYFENYKSTLISIILFLLLNITFIKNNIINIMPKIIKDSVLLHTIVLSGLFAGIHFASLHFI